MNQRLLPALILGSLLLGAGGVASAQDSYTVRRGDSLSRIANRFGVTVAELKSENRLAAGRRGDVIHPGDVLRIPGTDDGGLPSPTRSYTVRSGDSLSRIAQRFGTTVSWLRSRNGIRGSVIHPGQRLTVPGVAPPSTRPSTTRAASTTSTAARPSTSSSTTVAASSSRAPVTYTVVRGDSLGEIASRFGTSVSELRAANGISGSLIHPGDRLRIPGRSTVTMTTTHSARGATARELEVMARIIKGEAPAHAPWEGQVAIGAVILNRVRSSRFPNSIIGVAHQRSQFSAYNSNVRNRLYWGHIPDYAWRAARAALRGEDPTHGSTYYFNPFLVRPSWARRLEFVRRIGRSSTTAHDFYRIPGTAPRRVERSGIASRLSQ